MAKQRLVDFRGGINKKISPHMIGDSQGQDAQNLDMSAVRLEGRYEIDTLTAGAAGSYWYDSGISTGRWVSKYAEDDTGTANEPYIAGATDFAVWNRDLYVARSASPGTLLVFRDGATTPAVLQFNPPASVSSTVAIPENTLTNSVEDPLIAAIPSQSSSTQTVTVDVAGADANATEFNYSQSGTAIQQPWETATYETWTKTGDTTVYYRYSGDNLYTRSTGSSGSVNVTVGTANRFSPVYTQDSGSHQENGYYRWYQGATAYWAEGTSSTSRLFVRSSSTSSATQVTTSNYNTQTWSNGDTYTLEGTVVDGHTKYLLNGTTELWANNSTGQFKTRTTSTSGPSTQTINNPTLSYSYNSSTNSVTAINYWSIQNRAGGGYEVRVGADFNGLSAGGITWGSQYQTVSTYQSTLTNARNVSSPFTYTHPSLTSVSFKFYKGTLQYSDLSTTGWEVYNLTKLELIDSAGSTTYSYSNHTNTYITYNYSVLSNSYSLYNYSGPKTEQRVIPYVPETPAYYYDDARSVLYIVKATDADVGDSSPSFSNQWLVGGRDFSLTDNGYYVRTVREQYAGSPAVSQHLPLLSQGYTKVTLATNNNWIFGTTKENTPQRLNFTITAPTDSSTDPLACYRLERRDSFATVDLCYFKKDATSSFFVYTTNSATAADNYKVTFVTNSLDSSKRYKVSWVAYQDSKVRAINGATVGTSSISGSYEFDGSDEANIAFEIVDGTDTRYKAADFRLEERVIDPDPNNSAITGTFALIRCFDVFDKQDGSGGTIQGECDFLEGWPNGLGCGGLDSSGTQAGVPDYLKFLEESNNFFFGVGTASTDVLRYGGAADNKAGSFLFVSDYNNPRNWEEESYVQFDEEITGIHSYPGELIVWTKNGTYRVFGSRPNEMRKVKLATTEGLLANEERSIALVGNYLVWVSQSGICFYDGAKVTNLTRGRFNPSDLTTNLLGRGTSIHASQINDRYYVINGTNEQGFMVDFSLEGFPITKVDLTEGDATTPTNSSGDVLPPVLVYKANENKLYSRRGVVEGNTGNNLAFDYTTRAFDGGSFGSLKLVKSVTINGEGSGSVQVYLDNASVFTVPLTVTITSGQSTEPKRIFLPASRTNAYGLPVADTWWVEITNWDGKIDWIDTDYEVIAG